ncbi:MAG: hypothetical protein AB1765_01300 [Candidatus Hydrogenedentota bacterium]
MKKYVSFLVCLLFTLLYFSSDLQAEKTYLKKGIWKFKAPSGTEEVTKEPKKEVKKPKVEKQEIGQQKETLPPHLRKRVWKLTPPSEKEVKVKEKEMKKEYRIGVDVKAPSERKAEEKVVTKPKPKPQKRNIVTSTIDKTKKFFRSLRGKTTKEEQEEAIIRTQDEKERRWGGRPKREKTYVSKTKVSYEEIEEAEPTPEPPEKKVSTGEVKKLDRTVYKDKTGKKKVVPSKVEEEEYEEEGTISRNWRRFKEWIGRQAPRSKPEEEEVVEAEKETKEQEATKTERGIVLKSKKRTDNDRTTIYRSKEEKAKEKVVKEEVKEEEPTPRGESPWQKLKKFGRRLIGKEEE